MCDHLILGRNHILLLRDVAFTCVHGFPVNFCFMVLLHAKLLQRRSHGDCVLLQLCDLLVQLSSQVRELGDCAVLAIDAVLLLTELLFKLSLGTPELCDQGISRGHVFLQQTNLIVLRGDNIVLHRHVLLVLDLQELKRLITLYVLLLHLLQLVCHLPAQGHQLSDCVVPGCNVAFHFHHPLLLLLLCTAKTSNLLVHRNEISPVLHHLALKQPFLRRQDGDDALLFPQLRTVFGACLLHHRLRGPELSEHPVLLFQYGHLAIQLHLEPFPLCCQGGQLGVTGLQSLSQPLQLLF
mmetsp:Transcript_60365/g.107601  ORF Transcript_60365/g.107601 Transcript_60365/m.107601 type:complete len:295 (-) Transcript_60365:714-1598(-)